MAQDRQAANADVHWRGHDFKVGDQVLLNLENITLPSDRNRTSLKLLARFAGPYTIVEQLSPFSFRLDLPSTMKISPVFHVDRFRQYQPSPQELGPRTPAKQAPVTIEDEEEYVVEGIAGWLSLYLKNCVRVDISCSARAQSFHAPGKNA